MTMYPLYYGMVPGARNVWSAWTDAVKSHGAVEATLFTARGRVNSYTGRFAPSETDIQGLNRLLERGASTMTHESHSTISFNGCTYVIKWAPSPNIPDVVPFTGLLASRKESTSCDLRPRYLVAWNGSRYLIVCRSKTMYIVALVENRGGKLARVEATLRYIDGLTTKLIKNGY